jgi:uncharacterized protein (DUF952 family)
MERRIFKVLTAEQWRAAELGAPVEAPVDVADGYVHFSTAQQLQSTLDKWFAGQTGCVLAEFDAEDFDLDLKWEKGRGGEMFPHVYGVVRASQARAIWPLDMGENGAPLAPDEVARARRSDTRGDPDVLA